MACFIPNTLHLLIPVAEPAPPPSLSPAVTTRLFSVFRSLSVLLLVLLVPFYFPEMDFLFVCFWKQQQEKSLDVEE